jgi:hypothetical protein
MLLLRGHAPTASWLDSYSHFGPDITGMKSPPPNKRRRALALHCQFAARGFRFLTACRAARGEQSLRGADLRATRIAHDLTPLLHYHELVLKDGAMFAKLLKGPPRKVLLLFAFVILAAVAFGGRYLAGRPGLDSLAHQDAVRIASQKAEGLLDTPECAKYRVRLLEAGQRTRSAGKTLDGLNQIYDEARQHGCEKRR